MFVLILLRSIIGEEVLLAAAIMINSFKVIRTYHSYTRAQNIQRVLGSIPPEVVKKLIHWENPVLLLDTLLK